MPGAVRALSADCQGMAEQRKQEPRKDAGSEEQQPAREAPRKWPSPEDIEKFKVKESRNGMPGYGQPDVKK
jgi:hypothetical protein